MTVDDGPSHSYYSSRWSYHSFSLLWRTFFLSVLHDVMNMLIHWSLDENPLTPSPYPLTSQHGSLSVVCCVRLNLSTRNPGQLAYTLSPGSFTLGCTDHPTVTLYVGSSPLMFFPDESRSVLRTLKPRFLCAITTERD